ncbi:unnamed protein product, partial [Mesorhabditis spiculigera]
MLLPEMLVNSALTFAATPAILASEKPTERGNRCAEVCAVCGDFSTGYHYEVPSCNGCKTFFRRTIVSERVFKCHKNGNCLFNKDIRCACRACRFKKCLEVGMNPKAIQCSRPPMLPYHASLTPKSPEDSLPHSAPLGIATNASLDTMLPQRKRAYDISSLLGMSTPSTSGVQEPVDVKIKLEDCDGNSGYGSSSGSPRASKTPRLDQEQMITSLLMYESRADFLRTSDFEPAVSLLDSLTKPCGLDDITKYAQRQNTTIRTMGQWVDLEITICVEYAKAFEAFRNLSIADKCVLIDDTCMPLALLSLALSTYNRGLPGVLTPDGQPIEYDGLNNEFFSSRIRGPLDRINMDRTSLALLKCIIFLHAECSALSDAGRMALHARREKYYEGLNAHVFNTQGTKAPSQMCDLVALAWTLFQVSAKVRDSTITNPSLHKQVIDTSAVWKAQ